MYQSLQTMFQKACIYCGRLNYFLERVIDLKVELTHVSSVATKSS